MSTTATSSADVIGLRRRTAVLSGSKAEAIANPNKTMTGGNGVSVLRTLNGHSRRSTDEQDLEDEVEDDKFESAASTSSSESSLDILPDAMKDDIRGGRKTRSPRSPGLEGELPESPSTRGHALRRRRSRNQRQTSPLASGRRMSSVEKSSSSWITYDLSIVVALVSPIGNWLTGGDHVKNILLIVFLIFYLHQLIEVPWTLYRMSVPQHVPEEDHTDDDLEDSSHYHRRYRAALSTLHAAHGELRTFELMYLFLSVLAPFLGATLLRHVSYAVTGSHEALSWFSTALFVLATGLRPWMHLIDRLKGRSEALNGVLTEGKEMLTKIRKEAENEATEEEEELDVEWLDNALQAFQKSMRELEKRVTTLSNETHISVRDLNTTIASLSEKIKDDSHGIRHINKNQNKAKFAQDARITALEAQVKILLARDHSISSSSTKLWDYIPRSPPISFSKLSRFVSFLLRHLIPGYSYNLPSRSRFSNSIASSGPQSPSRPPLSLSGLMNNTHGAQHGVDARSPGACSPLDTIVEEDLHLELIHNPENPDTHLEDEELRTPTQIHHPIGLDNVRSANGEALGVSSSSEPQLRTLTNSMLSQAQATLFYLLFPARLIFWILWISIIVTPIRASRGTLRICRSLVFNPRS